MYTYISVVVLLTITMVNGKGFSGDMALSVQQLPTTGAGKELGLSICQECIKESVSAINVLLNYILDVGIIEDCGDLCEALSNKTGSKHLGEVCLLVCDGLGIAEFIKILEHTDIDPIWYCQMADLCPINDHGDAKFVYYHMIPSTGRVGTEFIIDCSFTTKNGTGPGMLSIMITTPQNQTAENDFLLDAKKPGIYDQRIGIKTSTVGCSPFDSTCNGFPTGTFNVTAYLCDGECGSKHPHSSIYDFGTTSFTVTP